MLKLKCLKCDELVTEFEYETGVELQCACQNTIDGEFKKDQWILNNKESI